jgi:hypothetical protein
MRLLAPILLLCGLQQAAPEIAAEDFRRLHDELRPQKGESPWRDIAWMTSIRDARLKAAAEGKPVVIFTAADGSPLART